jgi:hypothetical protein
LNAYIRKREGVMQNISKRVYYSGYIAYYQLAMPMHHSNFVGKLIIFYLRNSEFGSLPG